ncbi:MAG: DJ-1/PfpI family protein [Anaerolineae bacterium]|nr:DJ-1/PfpI family protein [Anaerolineae bacterium]
MEKLNVAVLLFDDVEVLDFAGPFEVFSVTSELNNFEPFEVFTVAQIKERVRAVNGLSVNPDYSIANCPKPDIIIVPGGAGTRRVMKQPDMIAWLQGHTLDTRHTVSVCTGSLVLAQAGLLDGLEVTTHHELYDMLEEITPGAVVNRRDRFLDNGKIITAGGISAGIDMSLYLVEKLLGTEIANKTRVYMEYGDWRSIQ